MFLGLSNTLANFQSYINKIFNQKLDIIRIVYLDNILVYTKDSSQLYIKAMFQMLKQFQKYNFFIHSNKYRFYQNEIKFLSFVISTERIIIEEKIIKAVKAQSKSKSVQDIQVLLDFINFHKRFVKNFNRILVPLTFILQTIVESADIKPSDIQNNENKKNQDISHEIDSDKVVDRVGRRIKNLSSCANLAKSK